MYITYNILLNGINDIIIIITTSPTCVLCAAIPETIIIVKLRP